MLRLRLQAQYFEIEEPRTRGAAGPLLSLRRRACPVAALRARRPRALGEVVHAPRRRRSHVAAAARRRRSSSRSRSPSTSSAVQGAYRDIPLRDGETIDRVAVCEGGRRYRPAAAPSSAAATRRHIRRDAGRRRRPRRLALPRERRAAHVPVAYRFRGLAVAYDDVVDVNLKVWGDEWKERLGRLTATFSRAPGRVLRAWGHPVYVRGDVDSSPAGARSCARSTSRAASSWSCARSSPAAALTSTAARRSSRARRSAKIVAEEREDAGVVRARPGADRRGAHHPCAHAAPARPARARCRRSPLVGVVWWFFGRERTAGYDREYEQEPPAETRARARAAAARAGRRRRLARVHRDAVRPDPPRSLQGRAGHDAAADLGRAAARGRRRPGAGARATRGASSRTSSGPSPRWSTPCSRDGADRLSRFRERIEEDRTTNASASRRSRSESAKAIGGAAWFVARACRARRRRSSCSSSRRDDARGSRSTAGGRSAALDATSSCSRSASASIANTA